jgi:hypothetical protein
MGYDDEDFHLGSRGTSLRLLITLVLAGSVALEQGFALRAARAIILLVRGRWSFAALWRRLVAFFIYVRTRWWLLWAAHVGRIRSTVVPVALTVLTAAAL